MGYKNKTNQQYHNEYYLENKSRKKQYYTEYYKQIINIFEYINI